MQTPPRGWLALLPLAPLVKEWRARRRRDDLDLGQRQHVLVGVVGAVGIRLAADADKRTDGRRTPVEATL